MEHVKSKNWEILLLLSSSSSTPAVASTLFDMLIDALGAGSRRTRSFRFVPTNTEPPSAEELRECRGRGSESADGALCNVRCILLKKIARVHFTSNWKQKIHIRG